MVKPGVEPDRVFHASEPILVVGMGSHAYGREQRAATMLGHMLRLDPYFLISKYGDGTVDALLREKRYPFEAMGFGYIGRARPWWTVITLSQTPALYAGILRAYRRRRCHAVVVLSFQTFLHALPALACARIALNAPLILYLGDVPSPRWLHRRLASLVNRLAHRVVVNSWVVSAGMRRVGIDDSRITVVHNGVERARFAKGRCEPLRDRFGWAADAVLVGYLGQLREDKGAGDFLAAAEQVVQARDDCRFVLVGGFLDRDPFAERVRRHIRRVRPAGRITVLEWTPRVERIYRALDIVVVPSRYDDPAPNVVLEAMASGVPVVASRMGGNTELLSEAAGFFVEAERPEQIADRIMHLADDPALRARMGEAGRNRVTKRFDAAKNARLVERIVLEAIEAG